MSEFSMKNMAANLRAERARTRLSQHKVARLVGCSQGALQKWEAGECVPAMDSAYSLAELYGVTVDSLCRAPDESETCER